MLVEWGTILCCSFLVPAVFTPVVLLGTLIWDGRTRACVIAGSTRWRWTRWTCLPVGAGGIVSLHGWRNWRGAAHVPRGRAAMPIASTEEERMIRSFSSGAGRATRASDAEAAAADRELSCCLVAGSLVPRAVVARAPVGGAGQSMDTVSRLTLGRDPPEGYRGGPWARARALGAVWAFRCDSVALWRL